MSYPAALPGAVATVVGLGGLRVFSSLVFEPLVASNAVSYGPLGTVLIVQSWLIGVGWVIYGGQLFGRWFHDARLRAWTHSRRGHAEPGPRGAGYAGARVTGRDRCRERPEQRTVLGSCSSGGQSWRSIVALMVRLWAGVPGYI